MVLKIIDVNDWLLFFKCFWDLCDFVFKYVKYVIKNVILKKEVKCW